MRLFAKCAVMSPLVSRFPPCLLLPRPTSISVEGCTRQNDVVRLVYGLPIATCNVANVPTVIRCRALSYCYGPVATPGRR